ncbi:hypothetical protein [Longivirga aurantiaca]|uniref:Uncharacterized protein n=1 Tax=Longivirga aurantiaca TaxID=1837743 RepID=A0ABW1SZ96_9ACTN
MSQPSGRRAAFGAALLGVLLLLVSGVAGALPQSVATAPVAASSSAPSLEASTSQLGHAALRTSHASVTGAIGADRSAVGKGSSSAVPVTLLLLALACLAIAVRRARTPMSSAPVRARGSRAPPTLASC